MSADRRYRATSPGGIGNLGPGLDVLGCAIAGARDEVTAQWWEVPGVTVLEAGHPDLSTSPERHTSAIAAGAVLRLAKAMGLSIAAPGVALTVRKGLPLSGGQGGSAASAVAGAVATAALLEAMFNTAQLLECCLVAEAKVAGKHLDNLAPALLGGIVLVRSMEPVDLVRLPVPTGLRLVIVHPAQRLSTSTSRRALPDVVALSAVTHQLAQVAAMVAACFTDDVGLFGRAIDDRIAEPARAHLLPGFMDGKRAAVEAGALGASISGSGPTAFAIADSVERAERVAAAMKESYASNGIDSTATVTTIDEQGTLVSAV
ncbi:MAG: homoserine kinase [Gemmatimonadota bacterium]|nr:homoserine kinase [Gemmatimonadota bacterium]